MAKGKAAKELSGREQALKLLVKFDAGDVGLDMLVEREFAGLSTRERAFAMELVYGVLRWRIKIDWIIDLKSTVKTKKMEHLVLNILRLGVYQLLFLTKVPSHAVIDESVGLLKGGVSKKRGFVNAVLRTIDTDRETIYFPNLKTSPTRYLSIVHSHPEWLVERWLTRFGVRETIALCQVNNRRPPLTLRTNSLRLTREELAENLGADGIGTEACAYAPLALEVKERPSTPLPPSPDYYIQDEASQIVPYLLDPTPGEVVLDVCAAPGGKATAIAQLMENEGEVFALDISPVKVGVIKTIAKRLGTTIVTPLPGDGLKKIDCVPSGGFDAILIDAPCSGLGVIRRNPDIRYRKTSADLERLAALQSALLDNCAAYLKDGGRLVYSTCSYEPEENEEVVKAFLRKHRDFIIEDGTAFLPEPCAALVESDGFLRTFPHRHGMDGFFGARLRKPLR